MKLSFWEEEMSFNIKKILSVKVLGVLVKRINAYKRNQSIDFDETKKDLSKLKNKQLRKKMSYSKNITLWRETLILKRTIILKQLKEYTKLIIFLFE